MNDIGRPDPAMTDETPSPLALDESMAARLAAIREIVRQIRAFPVVGPTLTDDDLNDEDGLPK